MRRQRYVIRTVYFDGEGFDGEGREVAVAGVVPVVEMGSAWPTFGIVRLAIPNTHIDISPYEQSVFTHAAQNIDLAFDPLNNRMDTSKMHVFLSDVTFG